MKLKLITITSLTLALAGCGSTGANYRPIVDGPTGYAYSRDLGQCRQVAERKSYVNDDAKLKAVAGAVLGGLIGAASADKGDAGEGAVAGAVVGGLIGTGDGASEAHKDRKKIVIRCMRGRGHNVVG